MSADKSLHFSDAFTICCGSVSVDIAHSLVLAIFFRTTEEYLLPKGRKDVGESLSQTALRETFEETGFKSNPLPLPIATLATRPAGQRADLGDNGGPSLSTESVAVTQRTVANETRKIIFWFAGQTDSTAQRVEGTQEEGEDFDPVWIPFDNLDKLTFDDDRQVAAKVVDAVRQLDSKPTLP